MGFIQYRMMFFGEERVLSLFPPTDNLACPIGVTAAERGHEGGEEEEDEEY